MHMADALLSPVTGLTMWAASGALLGWSSRGLRKRSDEAHVPLMGVLGAFVFAAQMVNFGIPGTGSSGHLGGGLLLAILLGPQAGFMVVASVLTVQSLCFGDGGLLALGANVFNIGALPCFVAYGLVWRPLTAAAPSRRRVAVAAVLAAVVALQGGALGVVIETAASGISALPSGPFLAVMLPIHAVIGVVEGLATAALVLFLSQARPELLAASVMEGRRGRSRPLPMVMGFAAAALLTGGLLSRFASAEPDGLEWSLARAATAPLAGPAAQGASETRDGLVGAALTLALVGGVGLGLRWRRRGAR
jgi:cobalt/nickel transport system permease protein